VAHGKGSDCGPGGLFVRRQRLPRAHPGPPPESARMQSLMPRRGLWVVLVVFVLSLAATSEAQACSCVPITMREAFRESDGAIIGRLVKVEPAGSAFTFTYRVRHAYKARRRIGRWVTVSGAVDEASCGLPRKEGRSYGLFLYRERHHWASNSCLVVSPRKMRRAARRLGRSGKIATASTSIPATPLCTSRRAP